MTHFIGPSTGVPTFFGQNNQGLDTENVTVQTGRIFISDEVLFWTLVIGLMAIAGATSIFGILANITNIVIFIRQGLLSDSSTVSLFYLAINDLMCLVFLLWLGTCFALIYIRPADFPVDLISLLFITAGRPHVMFTQFTRWITFFISFERCMCVMFPFKVGTWFSPLKTAIMIPSMLLVIFFSVYFPLFVVTYLKWLWDPRRNRTILKRYDTSNAQDVIWVTGWLGGQGYQPAALLGVFICTQIMTIRLSLSIKWRQSTTAASSQTSSKTTQGTDATDKKETSKKADGSIGSKDRRLVQMIRMICILFLICYTPDFIIAMTINLTYAQFGISPAGRNSNFYFFLYTFSFVLEGFNSSINILIYYKMSSKYKKEFDKLFGRGEDKG